MEVVIEGMEGLVGRMELESEREKDRHSLAGEDSPVVVDSLVDGEVRHMVVGEGEECWRSSEQKDIAGLLEHSWVEEGIEAGRSPADRAVVEDDSRPVVGHHRSNCCLTL
jgi:hypothetical protein